MSTASNQTVITIAACPLTYTVTHDDDSVSNRSTHHASPPLDASHPQCL